MDYLDSEIKTIPRNNKRNGSIRPDLPLPKREARFATEQGASFFRRRPPQNKTPAGGPQLSPFSFFLFKKPTRNSSFKFTLAFKSLNGGIRRGNWRRDCDSSSADLPSVLFAASAAVLGEVKNSAVHTLIFTHGR